MTGISDVCFWCHEPLVDEFDRRRNVVAHVECSLRVVVGSVGHIRQKSPAFGGIEEDPEGLSLRDAARMAVIEAVRHGVCPDLRILTEKVRQRLRPSIYSSMSVAEKAQIDAVLSGSL